MASMAIERSRVTAGARRDVKAMERLRLRAAGGWAPPQAVAGPAPAGGACPAQRAPRARVRPRPVANLKAVELANLVVDTLQDVVQAARQGVTRIRGKRSLRVVRHSE